MENISPTSGLFKILIHKTYEIHFLKKSVASGTNVGL